MIGGKWTTFRAFAEQAADVVLEELGRTRRVSTLNRAIGGGADFPGSHTALEHRLMRDFGVSATRAEHLASHYGTHAERVLRGCLGHANDVPLGVSSAYTGAEIAYLAGSEFTVTLSDLVLRRTSLAITGALDGALLTQITEIFAKATGLEPSQAAKQCSALTEELIHFHGLSPERLTAEQTRSRKCV
jgi:glycerol-3-phosphate dehydrogenase